MPSNTTVTLGTLIEETLDNVYTPEERPDQTTVGANALSSSSDNQLTLAVSPFCARGDILEIGSELMLVTAVSDDATPVVTVARGYSGTTAAASHSTGAVVLKRPTWPRNKVARAIKRSLGPLSAQLPLINSAVFNRTTGKQYVELPADTLQVFRVRHLSSLTGRIADIGGWQFEDDLPTALVASGKALRVSAGIFDEDDLIVEYQTPYKFTGTTETDTVTLPFGADDLPALWAAAYLMARREVSKSDLNKVEEWNQEQAIRAGLNLRAIREAWGEYYRRVDEVKQTYRVPKHRPFRKMAKVW